MIFSYIRQPRGRHSLSIKIASAIILIEAIVILTYGLLSLIYLEPGLFFNRVRLVEQNIVVVTLVSTLVLTGYLAYLMFTRIFHSYMSLPNMIDGLLNGSLDETQLSLSPEERQRLSRNIRALASRIEGGSF